jgi:hypothetical protein
MAYFKTRKIISEKYNREFDSRFELEVYEALINICGIDNVTFQKTLQVIPKGKDNIGRTLRKVEYTPDFLIQYRGLPIYIEAKGFATDVYKLRVRFFKHHNPQALLLEVKQKKGKRPTQYDIFLDNLPDKLDEFAILWHKNGEFDK